MASALAIATWSVTVPAPRGATVATTTSGPVGSSSGWAERASDIASPQPLRVAASQRAVYRCCRTGASARGARRHVGGHLGAGIRAAAGEAGLERTVVRDVAEGRDVVAAAAGLEAAPIRCLVGRE